MTDIAIRVENLSKLYRIGAPRARHDTLRDVVSSLFRPRSSPAPRGTDTDLWALKDVSFEIKQGEVVGVIGRNGAGKSTLLKILSRITEPTSGRVALHGRVASLLEVGTGFHPELTGRDNIYLNGAILGMKRREIDRKFDEIVDFAEIERFLDTPVKRYSSGMYVRLAFAVAAHLEPEILLVDEVLAVGDVAFQRKCLGKMGSVARQGRTVMFVSHNLAAIRRLCARSTLFHLGMIAADGDTWSVLEKYLGDGNAGKSTFQIDVPQQELSQQGFVHTVNIENGNEQPSVTLSVGKTWQARVCFRILQKVDHFMIAFGLRTVDDVPIRVTWSEPCTMFPGEYQAVFREDTVILASGRYLIAVGLSTYERAIHYAENAGYVEFAEFTEDGEYIRNSGTGTVLNPMRVEVMRINQG